MSNPLGFNQNTNKTHCKNGHEFTPENTYTFTKTGARTCIACRHQYYKDHAEEVKKKAIAWSRNNKAARKVITAKWQRNNPENVNENHREWMKKHPEVRRANQASRRARQDGNGGDYSPDEWLSLKKKYHNKCVCCGKSEAILKSIGRKLVPDHVVPLSKGGRNDIENLQPLCHGKGGCNNKKTTKSTDYRK